MTVSQPPTPLPSLKGPVGLARDLPRASERESALRAERRAWSVLWLAFATFVLVGASAIKYVSDFMTNAHVDLLAQVQHARGLVLVEGADGVQSRLAATDLAVGTWISPTRAAAVDLRLFDGSLVTVGSDASVQLERMEVGRFNSHQTIILRQSAGAVRYQPRRALDLDVPGASVNLTPGSDVTIWVESAITRVMVYTGEASVNAPGASAVTAAVDQRVEVSPDHRVSGPLPRAQELLTNGDFRSQDQGWQAVDQQDGPPDVDGQRLFGAGPIVDGRTLPALRIRRDSVSRAHGETGLIQKLNRDVAGFRHLYLEAWVRVDSASLSGGGQLGSEYPMMLRLRYEGLLEGSQPDWVRGFYAENPEQRPTRNGQQLTPATWEHYRVDLMAVPDSSRPYHLVDLEVMGQGHSYDASIAAVRLIGD